MKRLCVLWLIILIITNLSAQTSNLRNKFFVHINDTVRLDSLPIIPSSIEIYHGGQAIHNYKLLWQEAIVIFSSPVDSVLIKYRVFPFSLRTDSMATQPLIMPLYSEIEPIPTLAGGADNRTIESQGRISRGIFFGSGQQPSLTSDFNLSLSGQIDENTQIQATIADNMFNSNNISGTYNFQDFDRAMISVKFPYAQLSLGDLHIRNNTGFFVNFNRSVRGGDYMQEHDSIAWHIGSGAQKGIFNRMHIQGEEGNQGPYRLRGKRGEEMIIVVSGSEKVYINGLLKKRGIDNDYTMDYMRGEITFTANCLITKDTRIIVEFEYWAFDYQRYSLWAEVDKTYRQGHMYYGFFMVKDNPAAPVKPLDKEQAEVLYNAGDSSSLATVFSADSVGYDKDKILYCRQDTTVNGQTYTIFRYCQDERATWQVNFSYKGSGLGDYILDNMQVNGRIYRWVGPGKGDYMPVINLPMPERKTITYGGGKWKLHTFAVDWEIAMSDYDKNLLSPFDDRDNRSINMRFGMGKQLTSHNSPVNDSIFVRYMLMQERFAIFSPFLPVEYNRDWNLLFNQWDQAHNIVLGNKLYAHSGLKDIFLAEGLIYPRQYQGIRLNNVLSMDTMNWYINSWISYNYSRQATLKAGFLRTQQDIKRTFGKTQIGLWLEAEQNMRQADSLLPDSYAFVDYNFFINHGDSTKSFFSLSAGQRYDWIYTTQALRPRIIANNIKAQWQVRKGNLTNNTIILLRSLLDTNGSKNTIIARTEGTWHIKRIGNLSLLQEAGQGTQPITEFYFLRVPTGQGQYAWIDFNGDGHQQINEFQLTTFADQANYVRVTLPGIQYIPVYSSRSALSFSFAPSLRTQHLMARIINRINNQFNLSVSIKNKSLSPTQINYTDTNIVYFLYNMANTLTIRLGKKTSMSYLASANINKDLLLGGERLLQARLHKISLRYRLPATFVLEINALAKTQTSASQLFATENYSLYSRGTKLSISKSGLRLQAQLQASYTQTLDLGTSALLRHARTDATISLLALRDLRISTIASLIFNQLGGEPNAQVQYLMMQGYGTGWNVSNMLGLNYKINKTFTLQADYQLRLVQGRAVHNFGFKLTGWF